MIGTLNALAAAAFLFVGGHFLLSGAALRPRLTARLGEGPFRGLYALVMLASFAWMVFASTAIVLSVPLILYGGGRYALVKRGWSDIV